MNDGKDVTRKDDAVPNDPELRRLLTLWHAPDVPMALDQRLERSFRAEFSKVPWWKRMLTASIPVPLPVAVAVLLLLMVSATFALRRSPTARQAPVPTTSALTAGRLDTPVVTRTSLKGFEPVPDINGSVVIEGTRP